MSFRDSKVLGRVGFTFVGDGSEVKSSPRSRVPSPRIDSKNVSMTFELRRKKEIR